MTASLDFLPLGGAGEIGMNLNLYRTEGRWLMVDAGVTFERTESGATQILYADASFIADRREKLDGLVITHAHQDHVGAVADLWPRLRCPVYATPFAAAMLDGPLAEAGLLGRVPVRLLTEDARFEVGPFDLERVPLTHSTVEMGALVIRTAAGTALHTGDWKLDPDPVAGRRTAQDRLQALGDEGIDVVVSDSTNADQPGWTASEGSLRAGLREVLRDRPGRIALPLFSTNVARIETLARLAEEMDRDLVFVGRSLERTVDAARKAGYLRNLPRVVPADAFGYLPPDRVLMLCTGSQGEARAGLARIARDAHGLVYLEDGDLVVFSARVIPGNEDTVEEVMTRLADKGVDVVTSDDAHVHVSGHPRQEELRQLYRWLRPEAVVPVHGTPGKLEAHAALAEQMGVSAVRVTNGDLVRLAPGPPRALRRIPTGRVEREERPRAPRSRGRGKPRRRRA